MKIQNVSEAYPLTLKYLKRQDDVGATRILKEFEDQLFSTEDVKAFFPRFLKSKNVTVPALEIVHYEWCQHEVLDSDFGQLRHEMHGLFVALSFQALNLGKDSSREIGIEPGLHAFWRMQNKPQYRQLTGNEKIVIDALSDDNCFEYEAFIQFLAEAGGHDRDAVPPSEAERLWRETTNQLLRDGIVIEMKTREVIND